MTDAMRARMADLGLLVLRLTAGGLMLVHGVHKMSGWSEMSGGFPDPFGVGSAVSLALAIFAEVVCSVLIMAGALTRLAVIPPIITMLVAALIIHADDPWNKKELAVVYLGMYLVLALTGAGRYAIDAKLGGKLAKLR